MNHFSTTYLDDNGEPGVQTYWRPNAQELADLIRGGHVIIASSAETMPPTCVYTEPKK